MITWTCLQKGWKNAKWPKKDQTEKKRGKVNFQMQRNEKWRISQKEDDFISGSDGYLQFEYSGCVAPDGNIYGPEETWTDTLVRKTCKWLQWKQITSQNTYYFKCQQNGKFLKMEAEGCVSHDKQRRIPLGDTDDNGEYM